MKKHTVIGWSMLQDLKQYQEEPLVRIAEQICRWHHERYDGKALSGRLKGGRDPDFSTGGFPLQMYMMH